MINDHLIKQLGSTMAESNSESDFLKKFYIPTYIFIDETKISDVPDAPEFPVLVFINSKSGGQLGGDLLKTYKTVLNEHQVLLVFYVACLDSCFDADLGLTIFQVFDVEEEAPDKVLRRVYIRLEKLKQENDEFATKIHENLRIIVS